MKWRQLVTYRFERNVGRGDRVFRVASGLALSVVGLWLSPSLSLEIASSVVGLGWAATGLVSKCGIYHLVGYSTRTAGRH